MKALLILLAFAAFWIIAAAIAVLYKTLRVKYNRPIVGVELLSKLLRKDDYVSIKGRVRRFSHITETGEVIDFVRPPLNNNRTTACGNLAFFSTHTLGYIIEDVEMLAHCDFIYGKYGVKWAKDISTARLAKERIDDSLA